MLKKSSAHQFRIHIHDKTSVTLKIFVGKVIEILCTTSSSTYILKHIKDYVDKKHLNPSTMLQYNPISAIVAKFGICLEILNQYACKNFV